MTKGIQPRGRGAAKTSTISVRDSADTMGLISGTGSSQGKAEALCWTFKLVRPSPAVKGVHVGTEVYGSFDHLRVLVYSGRAALGFAPDSDARKILQAKKTRDGDLSGRIVSVNPSKTEAEVQLCLV